MKGRAGFRPLSNGRWQNSSNGRFASNKDVQAYFQEHGTKGLGFTRDKGGRTRHRGKFVGKRVARALDRLEHPESYKKPRRRPKDEDLPHEATVRFATADIPTLNAIGEELAACREGSLQAGLEGRIISETPTMGWKLSGKFTLQTLEEPRKGGTPIERIYTISKVLLIGEKRPDTALGIYLQAVISAQGQVTIKRDGKTVDTRESLWTALMANSLGGYVKGCVIHISPA